MPLAGRYPFDLAIRRVAMHVRFAVGNDNELIIAQLVFDQLMQGLFGPHKGISRRSGFPA